MSNGQSIELLRGFMDDVSILVKSVPHAQIALLRTKTVVGWARMKLKPSKSRSLVLQRGKCMDVQPFEVDGSVIQLLQREPLRTLGRVYDTSISDRHCQSEFKVKLVGGLETLDRCKAKGLMKLWALHHILLLQVRWDIMVYELPLYFIETLEQTVSKFIRKWLGVSKSLLTVALYSKETPCPLPFQSLVHLFKSTKVGSQVQLEESAHKEVRDCTAPSSSGRKWKLYEVLVSKAGDEVNEQGQMLDQTRKCKLWKKCSGDSDFEIGAVRQCRVRLQASRFVGRERQGRLGLDFAGGEDGGRRATLTQRQELVRGVREEMEEAYLLKAVDSALQGKWTKWRGYNQRVLSWRSLSYGDPKLVRFGIGCTYDTLASPANLERWGLSSTNDCCLCGVSPCTVSHILSGCNVALGQGRYRYRHHCVLKVICHHIGAFINNRTNVEPVSERGIHFVVAGTKGRRQKKLSKLSGLLYWAQDWTLIADLKKRLVFPRHIVDLRPDKELRPDIVIYSDVKKVVIMIELTCPCEENFDKRHKYKLWKYNGLLGDCRSAGLSAHLFAIEVGARGYTAQSLTACLRSLRLRNRFLGSCLSDAGDEALRSSFWLWFLREKEVWGKVGFSERPPARPDPIL